MNKLLSLRNRWMAFLHDLLWVPAAILLAFWLRFNLTDIPIAYVDAFQHLIVVSLPVQALTFWYLGLYRGIWRYASLPDLQRILRAVLMGVLLSFMLVFIWQRLENMPRTVFVLYPIILALGLAIPRLLYRWLKDHHLHLHLHIDRQERKRALLIGAGRAGELLVRDLLKPGPYQAIGFLDDSERRQGQEIHGVRVIGHLDQLQSVLDKYAVEVVLLCMPTASQQVVQSVINTCQKNSIPCRTLPSVADLADGKVEVSRLRQVQIEDLLGRNTIHIDNANIKPLITSQCVLVTGAGGSIGSELCRQILQHQPTRLLLLDHGEFNLYCIEKELLQQQPESSLYSIEALLGDIRDHERMSWVFEHFQPDVVFNAAAYKHVPLVEQNPAEGVKTNVLGTCQLADLAVQFGVKKFIQISTDKAVNPSNVMGASKRSAEIYCQNLDRRTTGTAFITTRFGNVLGSAGSVVPLFHSQIEAGGPITVTHPDITRYFMTIPEAVSLILQAGSMGQGGEIFVLDMGEPIKITALAEQMIRLAGLEPGQDIEITFTGLRPGEKLFEELFHDAEKLGQTSHPKVMLSESRSMDWADIQRSLEDLHAACRARDVQKLHLTLQQLVPEFTPMPTNRT